MIDLKKAHEQRLNEWRIVNEGKMQRWGGAIAKLNEARTKAGLTSLSKMQEQNIMTLMENSHTMLMENTTSDALAYTKGMLAVIPPMMQALVADQVAIVQAIDRPGMKVLVANVLAGLTKGAVTATDQLIAGKTGHGSSAASRGYASDRVSGEATSLTGDGKTTVFTYTTARKPVIAGSVRIGYTIGATALVGTDQGDGTITGTSITTGTINYTTGAISLTFAIAPDNATAISLPIYRYNMEKDTAGIPTMDFNVTEEDVDVETFAIRADNSVFAAINYQKLYGMNLAEEIAKFATQEVRFSMDQRVLDEALTAATTTGSATTVSAFNATVGAGQAWVFHIKGIRKNFAMMSTNIWAKTLRASANVIVGGVNVASLVEQLDGDFKPAVGIGSKPPAGPYVMGNVGNRVFIANPFYGANDMVGLYRGTSYIDAGLIFAPYIPLYTTDPITLATLNTQRAFMSQAGIKIVNQGMFCYSSISGY